GHGICKTRRSGRPGETGRPGALPIETSRPGQSDQNLILGRRPKGARCGFNDHHRGKRAMKTSQDRILTTHTGSLPRPPELRAVLVKKDQGEPYDKAELGRLTREAVIAI